MNIEIYFGNLKECTYAGCAGNFFGVEHARVIEEGLYFVKMKDNKYIRLDELLSIEKKKTVLKSSATKKGEIFVDDLVLVNDLVESKIKNKTK